MNRKGSMMMVVLIALVYFMFGMVMYQFLKADIAITRTDLGCSSPATSGDMVTCLLIGGVVPMVIIAVLSGAGGYITDRAFR